MSDAQQNPGMLASLLCLMVGLTIASPLVLASDKVVRGPAKVLDGDTIVIAGEHVRLLAIDAPEDGQTCQAAGHKWPCGDTAGTTLSKLTADHEVVCRAPVRDRYRHAPRAVACGAGNSSSPGSGGTSGTDQGANLVRRVRRVAPEFALS